MKLKRKTVDLQYVVKIESCDEGIDRFFQVFGKKPVEISAANIRKYAQEFPDKWEDDLIFLADNMLGFEAGNNVADADSSRLIRAFMREFRKASK